MFDLPLKILNRMAIAFAMVAASFYSQLSYAADPLPGAACSVNNARIRSGGPETSGILYDMVCQGGVWVATLTYLANSNVGIGTTAPASKLDVNGTVTATAFSGPIASSVVGAGVGSAAAPSLSFSGDPNTGFYNASSNDTISIANGGANTFNISSAGIVSATADGGLVTSAAGTAAAPTFSFAGDPDTGWWHPAADTLAASNAGVETMRITSTGNVGIGTTTPTRPLQISGTDRDVTVYVGNRDSTAPRWPGFMGYNYIGSGGAGGHVTFTGYVSRGSPLSAISPVLAGDIMVRLIGGGNRDTTGQPNEGANITMVAEENFSATAAGSNIRFNTSNLTTTSVTEKMRITANGNVGIGNTAPTQPLVIQKDGGASISLRTYDNSTNSYIFFNRARGTAAAPAVLNAGSQIMGLDSYGWDGSTFAYTGGIYQNAEETFSGTARGSRLSFLVTPNGTTSSITAMRIDNAGRVGIGTTSPANRLHIVSASGGNDSIQLQRSATTDAASIKYTPSGALSASNVIFYQGMQASSNNFSLNTWDGTTWKEPMTITPAGNVGIGTTNPQAGLDIASTGTASSAVIVPRDTTANRPTTAVNGMIRYNTTTARFEAYQNGVWVNAIQPIVASTNLVSQNAALGYTTVYTVPADGFYNVSHYLQTITTGTAGTIGINIRYTTRDNIVFSSAFGTVVATGNNFYANVMPIYAKAGTNIQFSTQFTGVTGSPTYDVRIRVTYME